MIGVEDDLEGREDNKRGDSQKPQKRKRRMSNCDEVGLSPSMMMIAESRTCMTVTVEDMKSWRPRKGQPSRA